MTSQAQVTTWQREDNTHGTQSTVDKFLGQIKVIVMRSINVIIIVHEVEFIYPYSPAADWINNNRVM